MISKYIIRGECPTAVWSVKNEHVKYDLLYDLSTSIAPLKHVNKQDWKYA